MIHYIKILGVGKRANLSSNELIWEHLKNAKLFPCQENSNVEINLHDHSSRILRSFFFDCIGLENGTELQEVEAIITHNGTIEVTFNGIDLPHRADLDDTIVIIDDLENQLRSSLQSFLQNRDDLR